MTASVQRPGWSLDEMADSVARDLGPGWVVNLGIGLPTRVGDFLPPTLGVMLHSENGILGMGPRPTEDETDPDLVNAGKSPVTLVAGAAVFDHAHSFAIIRGGHLDLAIMGAHQVSGAGDLANWSRGGNDIGGVGGAMDLAAGAQRVWVMMWHTDTHGHPKLVEECTYPLTGRACVSRVYTNLAVVDVTDHGVRVRSTAPGVSETDLASQTACPLIW